MRNEPAPARVRNRTRDDDAVTEAAVLPPQSLMGRPVGQAIWSKVYWVSLPGGCDELRLSTMWRDSSPVAVWRAGSTPRAKSGNRTRDDDAVSDGTRAKVLYGSLAATLPPPTASFTATVRAMVEATADAVHPQGLTAADVRSIVAAVVQAQPRRDWRTDVSLVIAIMSLIVAWPAYRQDGAEYAHPVPPPNVTVVVDRPDPAEIERIVDERLREQEQRRAEHDGHNRRGTDR